MFCDLSSLRRWAPPSLATGALLASALVLSPGCGHKKSPIPPPSKVPQKAVVEAHQRGHETIVSFPFPTTTISGTALLGVAKIELWQYSIEVPEFAIELLAQEALARREAQELLDELGLPLYETPPIFPDDPEADPAAAGLGTVPATDAAGAVMPFPSEKAPEAPVEAPVATAEPESPSTATMAEEVDTMAATEDDAAEETPEEGETEAAEGETDGEGEETELTEEEQLAVRVEAARTLLISAPTPKSSFISSTLRDFKSGAELVLSIEGDEVSSSLVGDKVVLRLPLPPRPTEGPEVGHLFAAKIFPLDGKASDFSERAAILPSDTPPAPQNVSVDAQPVGIFVRWEADEDPPGGFRVYRRDAQTRLYGEPLGVLPLGTERFFLDQQAVFGARYIYGVTALETTTPLLEGDLSSEHELDYQDRFGPAIPGGLVAFPETGRVRLLWTTVANVDVAGYEILRRAAEEAQAIPLTSELVTRGQYLDETVQSGDVWFYSVVAVDTNGNRSNASLETEARVP